MKQRSIFPIVIATLALISQNARPIFAMEKIMTWAVERFLSPQTKNPANRRLSCSGDHASEASRKVFVGQFSMILSAMGRSSPRTSLRGDASPRADGSPRDQLKTLLENSPCELFNQEIYAGLLGILEARPELFPGLLTICKDRGFDVNSANARGETLLHWATIIEYEPAVEQLLQLGANANSTSCNGETPQLIARSQKNVNIENLLTGKKPLNKSPRTSTGHRVTFQSNSN